MTVTWSEIKAECGDFRAGFVSTFKKYEGLPTDEKDAQGRTVKVTATSFARHMGIPRETFREWKNQDTGGRDRDRGDRESRGAKKVLRDPERRKRALAELPASDLEDLIEESNAVAIDRIRAKRSEHETQPTTRDLMGSDPFKPDEFWADNIIIRVNRNARELASLIQRGGGLILGAMEVERAFDYLNEAEQLIAEARAAAQEQSRDKAGVS